MIVKLKQGSDQKQIQRLMRWIKEQGLEIEYSEGSTYTILGLIGDTATIDANLIQAMEIVESVVRIQDPFKKVNRMFHPADTVIELPGGAKIGGGHFVVMAGPCSVESEEQIIAVAKSVKAAGATILRGGAFKPRTSPYAFQGMGADGIELLLKAKEATGLPIVSEIMDISQLPYFEDIDILQVGARNMQNFTLLKEVGRLNKPVLLKRGLSATYQELLMSAEYIMANGNSRVILCERGIRTFETGTRNTLDITAIPYLKEKTHLPVVVDPSHAAGMHRMVKPLSLASVAAGCDGLLIEVHNDPEHALCDGPQSLKPGSFDELAGQLFKLRALMETVA